MLDDKLMSLLVDQQGSHGHGGFELERLPVRSVDGEGDGIVLDAGLGLGTQSSTLFNHVDQLTGYGNLALRLFGERHADGVANTLRQQGADTYGTLDAPVFALASLCDTQMQGIVHILLVHGLDKQTYGGNHDHSIRGFDADNDIVKLFALKNTEELHTALDNTLGGVTIARHDAVGE